MVAVAALGLAARRALPADGRQWARGSRDFVDDRRRTAAVLIEATEPVAYLAAQPDPLTVLVDLRNVARAGLRQRLRARGGQPGARRSASSTRRRRRRAGGARARVARRSRSRTRVRSQRNLIFVEVEREATPPAARPQPPPSARLRRQPRTPARRSRTPERGPDRSRCCAPGRMPSSARAVWSRRTSEAQAAVASPRLSGRVAGVPPVTAVGKGGIERVRVAPEQPRPARHARRHRPQARGAPTGSSTDAGTGAVAPRARSRGRAGRSGCVAGGSA